MSTLARTSSKGIGLTPQKLKTIIEQTLDENKAEDIDTIDLKGMSPLADYMVIANGRSTRQVVGLAGKIKEKLLEYGIKAKTEGAAQGDWVVVDCFDVIVHIFRPEVREFYGIEQMWQMDDLPMLAKNKPQQGLTV